MLDDLAFGGEAEARQAGQLAGLDLVQLVVAAQHQKPDLDLALVAFGGQDDGFDGLFQRDAEQLGHVLAFGGAGVATSAMGWRASPRTGYRLGASASSMLAAYSESLL